MKENVNEKNQSCVQRTQVSKGSTVLASKVSHGYGLIRIFSRGGDFIMSLEWLIGATVVTLAVLLFIEE